MNHPVKLYQAFAQTYFAVQTRRYEVIEDQLNITSIS